MNLSEFLRVFPLRTPNVMWLTGAGASVSAGLPTAGDMVWDFKRRIYCAETRNPVALCPEPSDLVFRQRLTNHFETKPDFPPSDSPEEYSFYFEYTYPDERERRRYIDDCVSGVRLSQGYLALAVLAKLGKLKTVWTTNFDRLTEDALTKVLGSTSLFQVATLDSPHAAEQAINEGLRPVLVKLHGDFQSRHLKNTTDELRNQDAQLRRCLTQECGRYGLAIVGYSGRDNSIMSALEDAIATHGSKAFPAGLFWFHRSGSEPFQRVKDLIDLAERSQIGASIVEIETFDELMQDLFTLIDDVPDEVRSLLSQERRRLLPADIPPPGTNWPVIRMNALPITSAPSVCRRVACTIGGTSEVREAIKSSQADVIAMRRKSGIICFGSDAEVRKAFGAHAISEFDLHAIDARRLNYESAELAITNEALVRAFTRMRPLACRPTRAGWKLFPDPTRLDDRRLKSLSKIGGGFTGLVPETTVRWYDSILVKVVGRLGRLWMLFEPSLWIESEAVVEKDAESNDARSLAPEQEAEIECIREFKRERSARRYNRQLLQYMDAWISLLIGPDEQADREATLHTFGIGDGVDAAFTIARTTAFSRRL